MMAVDRQERIGKECTDSVPMMAVRIGKRRTEAMQMMAMDRLVKIDKRCTDSV